MAIITLGIYATVVNFCQVIPENLKKLLWFAKWKQTRESPCWTPKAHKAPLAVLRNSRIPPNRGWRALILVQFYTLIGLLLYMNFLLNLGFYYIQSWPPNTFKQRLISLTSKFELPRRCLQFNRKQLSSIRLLAYWNWIKAAATWHYFIKMVVDIIMTSQSYFDVLKKCFKKIIVYCVVKKVQTIIKFFLSE